MVRDLSAHKRIGMRLIGLGLYAYRHEACRFAGQDGARLINRFIGVSARGLSV